MNTENKTSYRIADLESEDRPRERLARLGAQVLNNAELLAILLRVGMPGENVVQMAQRLLIENGGLYGLRRASFDELSRQRGVGFAKAAQIKAAIELGYRLRLEAPDERPAISSPADAAVLVQYEMEDLVQENLWVLVLDTRNRLMHIEKLYQGSLNASSVRIGELFKAAIQRNGASLILTHNHPSGDPTPSPEDAAMTRAAVQAGKLLDIDVLDHLVIGRGRFVSLKERKLGFA
ncbi:MAG: DNA repair protein RadC [Anaerolineae bacterium]|nr:DNA repair protein RadC [Anaerolineae bacterium]